MSDFDRTIQGLLSEADEAFIGDAIDETGYYKYALGSFRGQGSGMRILAWAGILIFGGGLIVCLYMLFQAETIRMQIIYATFAILLNSAQIALKLWFNMQVNRVALSHELRRLQLAVSAKT